MTARLRPRAAQPRRSETRTSSSSQPAAAELRDESITETEARKRLSSYVVVLIEKSSPAIDGDGNLIPSTWDKASHTVLRDISQQEARHEVRELNRETGCVSDKKSELSPALQRQLERAYTRLENTESDRRFIYALVQLDWKFKNVETPREYHGRHDKHSSKDRKRDKERHISKPRKERVSVTAYFKREPSSNSSCLKMYKRQQGDKKADGSQFGSSRMERQHTSGSQVSRSPVISSSSFSSTNSQGNLTPSSSVDDISSRRHYEEKRGRSRRRQSKNGEPLETMTARSPSRRESRGRDNCISPPVPDSTRPEPKPAADSLKRKEQSVCEERMARSRSVRDSSSQPRLTQRALEKQRDYLHHVPYYSSSGKDVKQLGDRLSRVLLADEPKGSESNGIVWRKQDAQRYMDNRRRFDQDPWELGRSSPVLYSVFA